ncbi:carbonic anhydrase/acetyltransferase-like protein (isoleucine patch superfamily) [Lewinella marina]|uniref:Gamma carbonic anhydrase family protein n=1 Tax=Neolewinella marina TaxID=438751 RepID=A0A2G0CJW7_9BACT|nr:gamma carbonic anhydrase family protein [Neolewinella marina]NJB84549.1 carbonic anhydrase/acetyltransferase-like protein (isoleucine patch superfamily) [Neolewinella marina]PHL00269.1 gamma carbonic anhydrase family protein [Neolewinella marina]
MALIMSVRGHTPVIGENCFLAENATVVGEVTMGRDCSVWFTAVIRGDVNRITLGDRVNVQDGACIHCTYERAATTVGNDVSIGHRAIVHGCTLHDSVLIGMGAIVMDDAVVESNVIIGAGAVVPAGMRCEANSIYAGIPARKIKDLDPAQREDTITRIAGAYLKYASWFKD